MNKIYIWIWGMGEAGRFLYNIYLKDDKFIIKGLIDEGKAGEVYDSYTIADFATVQDKISSDDTIIVCCQKRFYSSISKQLDSAGINNYKHFYDLDFLDYLYEIVEEGTEDRCISKVCTEYDYDKTWFIKVANQLGPKTDIKHRKLWEWVYIIHVLEENQLIKKGTSAIGYAVGCEPLPSYLANKGVKVLATDLSIESEQAKGWAATHQNTCGDLNNLYYETICSKDLFKNNVSYQNLDMNKIPDDIGQYDFCWSSCAIEHVGSLELSKQFIKTMLKCLKPGGIAVHTTEFNLVSNTDTVTEGDSIIFRKKDFEELQDWMNGRGHEMELSFFREYGEGNSYIDIPPYTGEGKPFHLNLCAGGFAETSYAIVIKKNKRGI